MPANYFSNNKSTFRSPLILLVLFQLVLAAVMFMVPGDDSGLPRAEQGRMDLSDWNPELAAKPVQLNGQWAFYWERHLSGQDARHDPLPDLYSEMPNEWNGYQIDGKTLSGEGYATYKLTVTVREPGKELALKISPLATAYRLYIDDQLLASSGQAGDTREQFRPFGKPETVLFTPSRTTFDILVHVSNFDYVKGGMNRSLLLGSPDAIATSGQRLVYKDFFLIGSLVIASFYSISMYIMNREEKVSLYFGLVCFIILCRIPLTSSYLIYEILPSATIRLTEWINYMTFHLGVLFYVLMIREFFPQLFSGRIRCFLIAITAVIAGLLIALPLSVYSKFYIVSDVVGIVPLAYAYYVIIKAAIRKVPYSWFIFLGNGLLLTMVLLDIINTELNRYEMGFFSNYGMIVFTFIYSFILGRRFSQTFMETKKLSLRLLEIDKLKNEFLANTSHELKTPLQGIISISESLVDGVEGPLTDAQIQNLNMVSSSGRRLAQLINDILDASRLKHGDLQLHKQPLHIQPLVDFVMQMCRQMYPHKPIAWMATIPPDLPAIVADENRLVQILYNLVGNAAKFTDKGEVGVSVELTSGQFRIAVTDTGIGVDPEQLEHIFQPFTQADSSITRTYGGVGLGLSITKYLTELHGGHLEVASKPGAGSRFTVVLPAGGQTGTVGAGSATEYVYSSPVRELAAAAARHTVAQSGEHVLIVDDDPASLQAAFNLLKQEGYTITAVTNGREALDLIREQPDIRLVILDVMMPELSGYEVCRIIRQSKSHVELPVLMITAKHQPEDLALGFQAGVNDFLAKPFEKIEFISRVNTLVALNQSMHQALRSEIAFLQAQIKPHFIYNALGAIMSLCYTDGRRAGKLIAKFSRYLRILFDIDYPHTTIRLSKELELIHVYTEIERERFGDKLQVVIEVAPALMECPIAPLTIQPLVENAILHGVMKKAGGGQVKLTITQELEWMQVVVEDNGVGMSQETLERIGAQAEGRQGGVGLSNIRKRITRMGGTPLKLESEEGQGTTATLRLPVRNRDDRRKSQ